MKRYLYAFAAATLLPGFLFLAFGIVGTLVFFNPDFLLSGIRVFIFATMVSALHVFGLGVPSFFLLNLKYNVRWYSASAVGFVLGGIPVAYWAWPLRFADMKGTAFFGSGEDKVFTRIDGVVTTEGWLQYFQAIGFLGLFGAASGLVFWAVLTKYRNQIA